MSHNKINIIKELLNNYSRNITGEDFDNDLSEVRKDGTYSDDELINLYTEDVFDDMKKIFPGPEDLTTMYWFHKGRTSLKEIPERQKMILEKGETREKLKQVLSTLTPSDTHVIPKTFRSVQQWKEANENPQKTEVEETLARLRRNKTDWRVNFNNFTVEGKKLLFLCYMFSLKKR